MSFVYDRLGRKREKKINCCSKRSRLFVNKQFVSTDVFLFTDNKKKKNFTNEGKMSFTFGVVQSSLS